MQTRGWVGRSIAVAALLVGGCQSQDAKNLLESQGLASKQTVAAVRPASASSTVAVSSRSGPAGKTDITEGTGRFIGDEPKPRGETPAGSDAVTVNMVDVSVAQAAKAVLGDILSVPYVVDPKVAGKVSIATPEPVSRATMAELFQAALEVNGAAVVETGGVYRVVPAEQAATAGARVHIHPRAASGIGASLEVVQLHYVGAADMKRLLEPMTPKGAVVRADEARNVLTLSGSGAERAIVRDAIGIFDVDTMKGNTFAIVPVKSPDVDGLAEDVRNVFAADKEGPLSGMIRFVGNKRLSGILVISPQKKYIARAESWIRKLDARALGTEKQFYTYRVQNRPAKELVAILTSMFSGDISGSNQAAGNVTPRSAAATVTSAGFGAAGGAGSSGGIAQPTGATSSSSGPAAGFGATSGAGSPGLAPTPASSTSGGAPAGAQTISLGDDSRFKVAVDDAKNSVVVLANPEDYKRLLGMIHSLDQLPNQVLIEAIIAEVTLNDELRFGVRWFLQKNANSATFTNAISGSVAAVFPGFNYVFKAASSQITLDALAKITEVNVVSSPSLTVLDNKTATLQVGDQVPISTQTSTGTQVAGAPQINSVAYRDTGVILGITPHINESGRVILDIEQEVSSVSQTTSSNIDSPTIQQRKIKTTVVLNDNEALALGGLIQNKRTKAKDQVPILGDLTLIGNAFKSKDDTINKTELVIMIVPRVIRSLGEAAAISAEFREKLDEIIPGAAPVSRDLRPQMRRILE